MLPIVKLTPMMNSLISWVFYLLSLGIQQNTPNPKLCVIMRWTERRTRQMHRCGGQRAPLWIGCWMLEACDGQTANGAVVVVVSLRTI